MAKKTWLKLKRGLVRDSKHREAMGQAVWLYLHILDRTDFETGIVPNWKDEAEAEDMNLSIYRLRRDFRVLENTGYIVRERGQHESKITVTKWTNPRSQSEQNPSLSNLQSEQSATLNRPE